MEREGNGKGYRKGFLFTVMWGCVLQLMIVAEGGKWERLQKGIFMCDRKIAKKTVNFVMSVRPSALNNWLTVDGFL